MITEPEAKAAYELIVAEEKVQEIKVDRESWEQLTEEERQTWYTMAKVLKEAEQAKDAVRAYGVARDALRWLEDQHESGAYEEWRYQRSLPLKQAMLQKTENRLRYLGVSIEEAEYFLAENPE